MIGWGGMAGGGRVGALLVPTFGAQLRASFHLFFFFAVVLFVNVVLYTALKGLRFWWSVSHTVDVVQYEKKKKTCKAHQKPNGKWD